MTTIITDTDRRTHRLTFEQLARLAVVSTYLGIIGLPSASAPFSSARSAVLLLQCFRRTLNPLPCRWRARRAEIDAGPYALTHSLTPLIAIIHDFPGATAEPAKVGVVESIVMG